MGTPLTLPSQFPGIQSPYSIPRYSQCCSIAGPVNTEHPQLWSLTNLSPWRYHLYCILIESCLILTEFLLSDMSRIIYFSNIISLQIKYPKFGHRPQGAQLVSSKSGENVTQSVTLSPVFFALHHVTTSYILQLAR